MPNAKLLPSGHYRVRVYSHTENGVRKYESFTAPTKKEAEQKARQFSEKKDRGNKSDITVINAIKGYIAVKEKVLSPSTIKGYNAILHNYESIKDIRLSRLDNLTIQGFINELAGKSSPKYVRNVYALFTSSVRLYDQDLVFRITLPQKAKRIKKAPSDDDVKMLYDKASGTLKKGIFFGMLGLRRGEICALLYSDIEGNILHVNKDMVKGMDGWVVKDIPKTSESERMIELPDNFRDIIGYGDDRIVKCCPNYLTTYFHRLGLKNDIEICFHDLRHYFASIAHAMGIPDKYIMTMGGWKSDNVLKNVYKNSIEDIEKKYRSEYADKISHLI